jgi:signal transduction histidine kinase
MLRRFSVRNKLVIIVLTTTLCALLICGVGMMLYDLKAFRQAALNDLDAQANILGRASAAALAFDDPGSAQAYLSLLRAKPEIAAAAIYTDQDALFAYYTPQPDGRLNLPPPQADQFRVEGNRLMVFKRIVENNEVLGTVYLQSDFHIWQWLRKYFAILAAVMALSMIVAFALSTRLQAVVTQPILAISDVARQVMERRDFSLRAPKASEDEIGYLVDAFNDMLSEVERRAETLETSNRNLAHEITERRAAEEVAYRAENNLRELNAALEQRVGARTAELEAANKELEAFSYSVSHDLRAPVRSISGFVFMLREDHPELLDAEVNRKLEVILESATRMGELIDDLLAFSRLGRQAIRWTALDMERLARSVFAGLLNEKTGRAVQFSITKLPFAWGDPTLLEHVWINYLSNALKFSGKRARPVIEVGANETENDIVYFVRDNGAGFDPTYGAKLFAVFERLHSDKDFEGTGVGLALVHRIITRHGGRVWAEGEPDKGAVFYFSLPKKGPAAL